MNGAATLLLLFLVLLARPAAAITRPETPEQLRELAAIDVLIKDFNKNLAKEGVLQKDIEDLQKATLQRIRPDYAGIRKKRQEIANLQDDRKLLGPRILRRVVELYGLQLHPPSPVVQYPTRFQGEENPWTVLYLVKAERLRTDQGTKLKEKMTLSPVPPTHQRDGFTWLDGVMTVFDGAFASQGRLAATIVHETVHYQHMIDPKSRREPPSEAVSERRARDHLQSAEVRRLLRLTADDEKYLDEQYRMYLANPGAYIYSERFEGGDMLSELDVDEEALREIRDEASRIDRDIQADDARRLAESQANLNRAMSGPSGREDHVFIANEARQCGLDFVATQNVRFQTRENAPVPIFARFFERDAYKASLLLLWACGAPDDAKPCNDAFDTLASRWGSDDFKEKLYLGQGSSEPLAHCVANLVNTMKTPKKYGDIIRAQRRFWDERSRSSPGEPQSPPATAPRTPRSDDDGSPRGGAQPPARPRCRYMGDWCK